MISRTWHGLVPISKKDAFNEYLYETGVKDTTAIEGNQGAYVHSVEQEQYAHFFLCTIWSEWDDIKKYAGDKPDIAVTYPEDSVYGLISDPIVIHQQVGTNANPFAVT